MSILGIVSKNSQLNDFSNSIEKMLGNNLPKHCIEDHMYYLKKYIWCNFDTEEVKVVVETILGLDNSEGDNIKINFNVVMSLKPETFNALIVLIISCKQHNSTNKHYFNEESFKILRTLRTLRILRAMKVLISK